MGFAIQDLKAIRDMIADTYKIDPVQAARVVGFYNVGQNKDHDILNNMLLGDLSSVPAALSALGIHSDIVQATPTNENREEKRASDLAKKKEEKTAKRSAKSSKNDTRNTAENNNDLQAPVSPLASSLGASDTLADKIPVDDIKDRTKENTAFQDINADIIPTMQADIIPASSDGDLLPAALPSIVEDWLQEYALKYNIDLQKCAGLQWRGACLYVGQHFKSSDILLDRERTLSRNNKTYNPYKVAALIPLYEALTVSYKHITLACDFIAFSGVSREWFYDSQDRGLTSAVVDLRKKLQAIEESALSAGLVDSRENPTGRIFYSKARLGWRESVEIVHTSAAPSVGLSELPKLTTSGDLG